MDTNLKRNLRREASVHGMCKENRDELESLETLSDAISLYKKTIDWALEEGYPSMSVLEQYFSDCESEGIFINKVFHGELLNDQKVYVFHNCRGTIKVGLNIEKRIIPMLYFANGCAMKVCGKPCLTDVRVPLYIFGENTVNAEECDGVSFRCYKFDVK